MQQQWGIEKALSYRTNVSMTYSKTHIWYHTIWWGKKRDRLWRKISFFCHTVNYNWSYHYQWYLWRLTILKRTPLINNNKQMIDHLHNETELLSSSQWRKTIGNLLSLLLSNTLHSKLESYNRPWHTTSSNRILTHPN